MRDRATQTRGTRKPPQAPEISVLMTIFNTAAYLAEAIDSVLAQQTTRSFELLLVDDGSTDKSLAIANAYAQRHPGKVRVLRHKGGCNRGISASRNLAMECARGPLFAFLDSDDVWLPHHLETQCNILDRFPQAHMSYASAERWVDMTAAFDEAKARQAWWGSNYIPPLVPQGEACGLIAPYVLLEWFLRDESMVPCICTVVVRAAAARAVGGFQNDFHGLYDDQVFHAKMSLHYMLYANDACTARYRRHKASCCARSEQEETTRKTARRQFHNFLLQYAGTVSPKVEAERADGFAAEERDAVLTGTA